MHHAQTPVLILLGTRYSVLGTSCSIDLQEIRHQLLVPLPGEDALEGELHFRVAADQVAQLRVGILSDGGDQARYFDGVALGQGLDALAHAQAALAVLRRLLGGVLAHDCAASPNVGLEGAGFDQYYFNPQRTDRSEERRVGKECRSRWSPY